jgi:hypothetical protein
LAALDVFCILHETIHTLTVGDLLLLDNPHHTRGALRVAAMISIA